jgi:hypothetical protein
LSSRKPRPFRRRKDAQSFTRRAGGFEIGAGYAF